MSRQALGHRLVPATLRPRRHLPRKLLAAATVHPVPAEAAIPNIRPVPPEWEALIEETKADIASRHYAAEFDAPAVYQTTAEGTRAAIVSNEPLPWAEHPASWAVRPILDRELAKPELQLASAPTRFNQLYKAVPS